MTEACKREGGRALLWGVQLALLLVFAQGIPQTAAAAFQKGQHQKSHQLDPEKLNLASVSAMITDANSGEVLYRKNDELVVPIASLTKLMTAMVVLDTGLPLDEQIVITPNQHKSGKNAYSRIRLQSTLKRKDLLRLALMSSENRAAGVLGQSMPGGMSQFVKQMNRKAATLGMKDSIFVDSTGLSTHNISTAHDLSLLVKAALKYPLIRDYSTSPRYTAQFRKPSYRLNYGNTNLLVHRKDWDIQLSKTGYLDEAGRCLVMGTTIDDRKVIIVLLDSFGKRTPIGDAGRIKRWMLTGNGGKVSRVARAYEQEKTRKMLLDSQM